MGNSSGTTWGGGHISGVRCGAAGGSIQGHEKWGEDLCLSNSGGWGVHIKSVLTCAKIRAGGQPQDIPDKVPGKYKWPEGDAGVSELAVRSLSPTMGPECHRLILKAPQPARSEYSGPEAQQTAQGEGGRRGQAPTTPYP